MKLPDVIGTLTGVSLLGADAVAADTPVIPIPEPHSTGNPWADVALFALRIIGIVAVISGPSLLGRYLDNRSSRKKGPK